MKLKIRKTLNKEKIKGKIKDHRKVNLEKMQLRRAFRPLAI
jgi:hypothetical protein